MNQYTKKKNFLQTLFEFGWVKCVTLFLAVLVVPFLIGLPVMKIPGATNTVVKVPFVLLSWSLGLIVICACGLVVIVVMLLKELIPPIARDLHAAKIMQYLPLTKEDWERLDAKTDEDAVRVLRNLVKTVGFNDDLIDCYELRDQIIESYRAFLDFNHGNKKICIDIIGLVLCSDAEFEQEQLKREKRIVNT